MAVFRHSLGLQSSFGVAMAFARTPRHTSDHSLVDEGSMAGVHFENQMSWVKGLSGDEKVKAGTIVAWQSVATTLNELVKHFNSVTSGSEQQDLRRDREVQLKKVIIGMLYEMDACLDFWAGKLNDKGLLDQ